jgi:hypothetical protein
MAGNTVISSTSRKNNLKRWLSRAIFTPPSPALNTLMIMGAQRSGTTLLSRIFDDLYYADVYGEFSDLSSNDKYRLRLNSPDEVNKILTKANAALSVLKPLVESQRACFWMDKIPSSAVVWLYRDYRDVASSSVLKFGPREGGISQARAFVDDEFAGRDYATWKAENASQETLDTIRECYSPSMEPTDAAALFWYGRNKLFSEQQLEKSKRVILVKYEAFVAQPFLVIAYILNLLGIQELKSATLTGIDRKSIGKGSTLQISDTIDGLCVNVMADLDRHFYTSPLGKMLSALDEHPTRL